MANSIANTIENLLDQIEQTQINIGQTNGHFISTHQLSALRNCVRELHQLELNSSTPTSSVTEADPEDRLRSRIAILETQIRQSRIALGTAPTSLRPRLNTNLGQLLSERATLNRILGQLGN